MITTAQVANVRTKKPNSLNTTFIISTANPKYTLTSDVGSAKSSIVFILSLMEPQLFLGACIAI